MKQKAFKKLSGKHTIYLWKNIEFQENLISSKKSKFFALFRIKILKIPGFQMLFLEFFNHRRTFH